MRCRFPRGTTSTARSRCRWSSACTSGTTGAPPVSNVTITEAYLELTTDHFTRGLMSGATAREWVSCLLAVRPRTSLGRLAITPSDTIQVSDIVETAGGDTDDVYYGWDEDAGTWEAYETTTPGTLRATFNTDTGTWEAP